MLTAMGDVMREAYKRNWITTRDGNISLKRSSSNVLYITPSGVRKTIIHPEHIIKIPIRENELDLEEGINHLIIVSTYRLACGDSEITWVG